MSPATRTCPAVADDAARFVIDAVGPEDQRRTILAFLEAHPDALHRTCLEGHLTGSAAVVDATRTRAVLVLHRKLGRWLQPGGHADGDADLAAVALTEAEEETGIAGLRLSLPAIDLDVHEIPARPGESAHVHLDVRFLAVAPDGADPVCSDESDDVRWVTLADLDSLAVDDSTRRLLTKALRPRSLSADEAHTRMSRQRME